MFVPIGCGNIVPHVRSNVVLKDAFAASVKTCEEVLSLGITLLVEALREIGMLAIRNKNLYRTIMSLKSAFIEAAANPEKDY